VREGPVEQIVEALSRDVAPVTGKWPRSATISWWTSALAGGVFRIPHTNLAAHLEPRFITAELTLAHTNPAIAELIPLAEQSLAEAERAIDGLWTPESAVA
jgi:hypothetical protein